MNYQEILKYLAKKENIAEKEVEKEMQIAINKTGLNCSAEEFIKTITDVIIKDYI